MINPSSDHPFDSLAVRWQQRSASAAGLPSVSRNRTMFSPSKVNGLGPSSSLSTGTVAYQNRRRTFCFVQSMAVSCLLSAQLVVAPFDQATGMPQILAVGAVRLSWRVLEIKRGAASGATS